MDDSLLLGAQVGELVKHTPAALGEEKQLLEELLENLRTKCSEIDAATS